MKTQLAAARVPVLALASALAACQAPDYEGPGASHGVRVNPNNVLLGPSQQQAFAAAPPTVTWSIRQGPSGGSITAGGVYTAPGTPGTYTVVATEDGSGRYGEATVNVVPVGTTISHGMAIPSGHPKLWYDPARLARARTWYASHPMQPDMNNPDINDRIEMATRGLLNNEAAMCRPALDWAIAQTNSMPRVNVSCDNCRWYGEAIILAYDWCYAFMTPAERASFVTATNLWMTHWMNQSWGGPHMPENNYHWGYTRNQLMWAIASYHENVTAAEMYMDDVFTDRLAGYFYPSADTGPQRGGIGREGTQYGIYIQSYAHIPWTTGWLLGRDLFNETDYWREAAYHLIYSLSPAGTTGAGRGQTADMGPTFFPYSDDEQWLHGDQVDYNAGNFMATMAMRYPDVAVGRHARQWLLSNGARTSEYVQSVDIGNTPLAFTGLPLEFYGRGAGMLYGRSAWGPAATTFHLQLKDGPENGHSHLQWGNWQLWRNGRYVSRETVAYGESITGFGGSGTASADLALGHNLLVVNGAAARASQWVSGLADVVRLESRPGYAFAVTDLTDTINNANWVSWVREFVFVRGLETLVVLDRVQSSAANAVKTFLAHCEVAPAVGTGTATCTNGDQAMVMTTLVPATSTYRSISEGGTIGQYRIEVDTTPGTAQSYVLTVLQAKAASGASLSPSVSEDATTFTVTLDGSNSIVFQKGMDSAGGSITVGGTTTALRADVQNFVVGENGPAWE